MDGWMEELVNTHKHMAMVFNRYRWTKDGEDFTPPQSSAGGLGSTGNFSLPNVHPATYQGMYQCYASNRLGTAMTDQIQLIVPSELTERTN